MHEFIAKHHEKIAGTLAGFDRLVIRGHLRSIGYPQGMMRYLWANQVFLKNFGDHVEAVTERLKQASLAQAKASGRKKPTALRVVVGVRNCESSDRIKGCDGARIHAVGSLAGANGWSVTNVAAFPVLQRPSNPFNTSLDRNMLTRIVPCYLPTFTAFPHE